jgi:alanyl-tRNA synthetase
MALDDAQKSGAMMLFGEKYGETVRVLSIGSSPRSCAAAPTCSAPATSACSRSWPKAAWRPASAVSKRSPATTRWPICSSWNHVHGVAGTLKATPAEVPVPPGRVLEQVRALEKEIAALKGKLASARATNCWRRPSTSRASRCWPPRCEGADAKTLRETMDKLKDKLKTAAIVLAAVDGGKVQLAAGVTADAPAKVKAGELVNFVAQQVGGKGGGKPDMAMAGGTDAGALAAALASVAGWVGERNTAAASAASTPWPSPARWST